jgi:hypothetical protein
MSNMNKMNGRTRRELLLERLQDVIEPLADAELAALLGRAEEYQERVMMRRAERLMEAKQAG